VGLSRRAGIELYRNTTDYQLPALALDRHGRAVAPPPTGEGGGALPWAALERDSAASNARIGALGVGRSARNLRPGCYPRAPARRIDRGGSGDKAAGADSQGLAHAA
jgi:hypothetical protein